MCTTYAVTGWKPYKMKCAIKLLILDVDGVLTDGTKEYDKDHSIVSKKFLCKDFTAIKRFMAAGVKVIMISGDEWNRAMADKRNIDFYCSRGSDMSLDKSKYLGMFANTYSVDISQMAFVGDDYFDLSMFRKLECTFCPSDAPNIIKHASSRICSRAGGEGVIVEIYDLAVGMQWICDADPDVVAELDKQESTSREMS